MKDKLLGLKAKTKEVEVEGLKVTVTELNIAEFQKYQNSLYEVKGSNVKYKTEEAMTKLIALTVLEEDGSKMFDLKDISLVNQLPSSVADALFQAASELNGLNSTGKN